MSFIYKNCNLEFWKSENEWFLNGYILSIFRKKETIILYLNMSLNTILSTDIYIALEQEVCLPSRSEYNRLIAIILDLPSGYD